MFNQYFSRKIVWLLTLIYFLLLIFIFFLWLSQSGKFEDLHYWWSSFWEEFMVYYSWILIILYSIYSVNKWIYFIFSFAIFIFAYPTFLYLIDMKSFYPCFDLCGIQVYLYPIYFLWVLWIGWIIRILLNKKKESEYYAWMIQDFEEKNNLNK